MWLKFTLCIMAVGLFLQISHSVDNQQEDLDLPKCYAQSLEAKQTLLQRPYEVQLHRHQIEEVEDDWCACLESEYYK